MSSDLESRIKAAIQAGYSQPPGSDPRLSAKAGADRSKRGSKRPLNYQRVITQAVAPLLWKDEVRQREFEAIRARDLAEMRRDSLASNRGSLAGAAAREAQFQSMVNAQREGLEALQQLRSATANAVAPQSPYYIPLHTPFLIAPSARVTLDEAFTEPWNSRTRFKLLREDPDTDGDEGVTFYFLWINHGETAAFFNVTAWVLLNGHAQVRSNAGSIYDSASKAKLWVGVRLTLTEWFRPTPLYPVLPVENTAAVLTSDATGFLSVSDFDSADFGRPYDVRSDLFAVHSRSAAVIAVNVYAKYELGGDSAIEVDFSEGGRRLVCPYALLGVMSPTTPATNPTAPQRTPN